MSPFAPGRVALRHLSALLALVLCLTVLPARQAPSAAAGAVIYRVRIPIVTGPRRTPLPTTDQNIDAAVAAGNLTPEAGLL